MAISTEFYHHALISRLVYKDEDMSVRNEFREMGYKGIKFFDIEGAQVYVLNNDNRITVAFRGTEPSEMSDVLADLEFIRRRGFHQGFLEEYEKLENKITAEVAKLQQMKRRPVYITGHSLGAAIACIFAYYYPSAVALYTYGCPRNMSWSISKNLRVPHYRCVNNNDIVPKVPPVIFGFKHTGQLKYINYYGNIRKMTPWQRFKDSWRGRMRALKKGQPFDGVYDHSMDEYCRFLEDNE